MDPGVTGLPHNSVRQVKGNVVTGLNPSGICIYTSRKEEYHITEGPEPVDV